MFLIDAKHDGLLEAVATFLKEIRNLLGNELGAVVNDEGAIKILGVVDPVFYFIALAVGVPPLRPVALDIEVNVYLDDLVGGEEAVFDALLQGVGVYRLPEIMDVGDILGFFRRGRQPDLGSGRKLLKNLSPRCIVGRTSTVTLIDDDQVKESRREFPEQFLALFGAGDCLVQP